MYKNSNSSEVPKGFASVQDVKFPYEEKPLNLAYYFSEKSNECTPVYMYLHRAAPVKGKYIASVRVATYNPDQSWSKEEREANNTFSNDSCYISLLGSSSEILNQSLALYSTDAWYNTTDKSCTDACVFIGYHYYNPDYVNTKRTKYYMESAVKDLYVYVGENPEKRLTIDKRKYTLCGNRNLNYGTGGTPMYLYQTTALINNKDKKDASYITSVAAAQYDRVPADIAENMWENLLTTENKRINMNEGVRGFERDDKSKHLIDSRIYLFVHRNDSYVKPEAAITGGYFTETTTFGDVVLSKK